MPPVPPTAWSPDPDSDLGLAAERQATFVTQATGFDFRGAVAASGRWSLLRSLGLAAAAVLVGALLSGGVLFGLLDRARNGVSGEKASGRSWALWASAPSLSSPPSSMPTLKVALAHQREYCADALAAFLRRDGSGLASALLRISENLKVARADHAVAKVYILFPFGFSLVDRLLSTYLPTEKRIARLLDLRAD